MATPRPRARPDVSVHDMQQIDQRAISILGIPRLLLMEHAGMAVAREAYALLCQSGWRPPPRLRSRASYDCVIVCGRGYNGGDGLSAARHLARWRCAPLVLLRGPLAALREEPAVFANMLTAIRVPLLEVDDQTDTDMLASLIGRARLLIDALLGIGIRGIVRPPDARLIELLNRAAAPVVAVDVPSGLNADTGRPQNMAVRADLTVSLGWPKQGLCRGRGLRYAGRVVVDAITIPDDAMPAFAHAHHTSRA